MGSKRSECFEDDDEAFRKYIVVDMESDDEKENIMSTSTRTKQQQIALLETFMKGNL